MNRFATMASKQHGDNDSDKNIENRENKNYNPKLDFYSDSFDPLLALKTPNLIPPVANAKIYDNIDKYVSSMQKYNSNMGSGGCAKAATVSQQIGPQSFNKTRQGIDVRRRWQENQLPVKREKRRQARNIFTRMENFKGPLSLLNKCKDKRLRIKVWTRHSHNIRGYFIGYLIAYDRHWNLALEEIEEVWTRKKKRKVPALESVCEDHSIRPKMLPPAIKIIETTKTTETCSRNVHQLMVRGEQIVFIVILNQDVAKT